MEAARPWRSTAEGVEVRVRVTPRGERDALGRIELLDDGRAALRVRVRAAPADGAANAAVRRVLAECLGRPMSAVTLKSGASARIKVFAVAGADAARVVGLLGATEP
jgi:uncharacterized protein YggU (UPF0235/DUF167 family)